MSEVVLVSMPFADVQIPSLGVAVLLAQCRAAQISIQGIYPYLDFAQRIGLTRYSTLSANLSMSTQLGEWLFAPSAFSGMPFADRRERYLDEYLAQEPSFVYFCQKFHIDMSRALAEIRSLRKRAEAFVLELSEQQSLLQAKILAFSASFYQLIPSLALIRKIKEHNSKIITVLGGSHCEGSMGYSIARKFPWVDLVCSGNADRVFPRLCKEILGGTSIQDIRHYGVFNTHCIQNSKANEVRMERDLDSLAVPDYTDFYRDLRRTGLLIDPYLCLESSRGCWKGMKNHCTFCGGNGALMDYRTKTPDRVFQEMDTLHERHHTRRFLMTDTVLHFGYFQTLLPQLKNHSVSYELAYGTVSTLNEEQVNTLADAGVSWLTPGVEGLQEHLLELLNKSNSTLRNVAFLKYCQENRLLVSWNLLSVIPGDCDEYYWETAHRLPQLFHLPPPQMGVIRFDRNSPYYLFQEKFGLSLTPERSYSFVYPFTDEELKDFAWFFEDRNRPHPLLCMNRPPLRIVRELVAEWNRRYLQNVSESLLECQWDTNRFLIRDQRPCARTSLHVHSRKEGEIYEACHSPIHRVDLINRYGPHVNEILDDWIERFLILEMDQQVLALATRPPRRTWPPDSFPHLDSIRIRKIIQAQTRVITPKIKQKV